MQWCEKRGLFKNHQTEQTHKTQPPPPSFLSTVGCTCLQHELQKAASYSCALKTTEQVIQLVFWIQFSRFAVTQSHRFLFSTWRSSVSVRVSRLYAVFFKSCRALCMNSNAWQSTQGRLSAGMAVPASWSDLAGSMRSSAATKTKGTVRTGLLRRQGTSIVGTGASLWSLSCLCGGLFEMAAANC